MFQAKHLEIEGDVTSEVCLEFANILKRAGFDGEISMAPAIGGSSFTPDYTTVLQTASAIAAVLSLVLNYVRLARERKKAASPIRLLRERLSEFKASDFEVISVSDLTGFVEQNASSATAVLRDIPSNQHYQIRIDRQGKVSVRRIPPKGEASQG